LLTLMDCNRIHPLSNDPFPAHRLNPVATGGGTRLKPAARGTGNRMTDVDRLIERLRRIEALHAGAATAGERAAAANAMEIILTRLREAARRNPPIEYRFSFDNEWSRKLFVALLRRYGLRPFRYFRQRYNTVMVEVPESFVNETLWPEFQALDEALREHLEAVAGNIIAQAVSSDTSEPEERRELSPGGEGRG
jgi:hypothetical protein